MKFLCYLLPVSLLLLAGCAMPVTPRYSVSAKNVVELRDLYGTSPNKIKVGEITSSNQTGIFCRLAEIQIPDGLTMAAYVKNSFSDELKLAGVYSDKSSNEVRVKILNLDVDCNIGTGNWITEMEITIGKSDPFTVKNIYNFEGAYMGTVAYNNAQQSLVSALQDFYGLIIKHPNFAVAFNTIK